MTKYTHINAEHNIVVANNTLYKIEADFTVRRLDVQVQDEILQLESISFDVEEMEETNKGLFILTTEDLFKLRDGKLETVNTPYKFTKLEIHEKNMYGYIGRDTIYNFIKDEITKTPCDIKKALFLPQDEVVFLLENRTLLNIDHPANGRIIDCLQNGKLVVLTLDGEVYFGNDKIITNERIEKIFSQYVGTGYSALLMASKSKIYFEQIDILSPENSFPKFIERDTSGEIMEFIELSVGCRYIINNEVYGTLADCKSYINDSGVVSSSCHFEVDNDSGRDLILHRDGAVYYVNKKLLNRVLNVDENPKAMNNPFKLLTQEIEV